MPDHVWEAWQHLDAHEATVDLLPRGHVKTTGLSVMRTAYKIGRDPGYRVMLIGRGERMARRISRRIKRIMRDQRYVALFGRIAPVAGQSKDTESEWERIGSTAAEPTFVGVGVGGPVPGTRADEIVCDDMINRQMVQTKDQRDKLWDWLLMEVVPVANDAGSSMHLIGTRYHEDDIYGRAMKAGSDDDDAALDDDDGSDDAPLWSVFIRKAIQDDGTALWPAVWTIERLEKRRRRLGDAIFALQYQQDTSGMGGLVIKQAWIKYVGDDDLAGLTLRITGGLDLNISEDTQSDETALVLVGHVVARDRDDRPLRVGDMVVLDAWSDHLLEDHDLWLAGGRYDPRSGQLDLLPTPMRGSPGLLHPSSRYRDRVALLVVESVAFQAAITRTIIRTTRLPARPPGKDMARADKTTRLLALQPHHQTGRIVYHHRLRGSKLIHQLVGFPNAEHDDLPDALVYAAEVGAGVQVFA